MNSFGAVPPAAAAGSSPGSSDHDAVNNAIGLGPPPSVAVGASLGSSGAIANAVLGPPASAVSTTAEPRSESKKAAPAKAAKRSKPRKAIKKKPDDMPRRPLSAYNFFFSAMRQKLVAERAEGKDTKFQEFLAAQNAGGEGKKNGFFSNMGKFVAKRWKELSKEEMKPYTDKADQDLERYRREMDEYREGVAKKTRIASEKKLREQETAAEEDNKPPEAASVSADLAQPFAQPGLAAGVGGQTSQQALQQQSFGVGPPPMGGIAPGGLDSATYQLLLRQQLAANPQIQALLLQQQIMATNPQALAGLGGMGAAGFNPMFAAGAYGQLLAQQQQQAQAQPQQQQQQQPQMDMAAAMGAQGVAAGAMGAQGSASGGGGSGMTLDSSQGGVAAGPQNPNGFFPPSGPSDVATPESLFPQPQQQQSQVAPPMPGVQPKIEPGQPMPPNPTPAAPPLVPPVGQGTAMGGMMMGLPPAPPQGLPNPPFDTVRGSIAGSSGLQHTEHSPPEDSV